MLTVKPLPGFTAWLDGLADANTRGVVLARIKRLERGLLGDVRPVGQGVSELRIHVGPGWRVFRAARHPSGDTATRGEQANTEGGYKAGAVFGRVARLIEEWK